MHRGKEMHVLDSSALIDLLKDNERGAKIIKKIGSETAVTTVFSIYELLRVDKRLGLLFDNIKILDFDQESAKISALLDSKQKRKGKTLAITDQHIASICISNDATLITCDKDFLRADGLKLIFIK